MMKSEIRKPGSEIDPKAEIRTRWLANVRHAGTSGIGRGLSFGCRMSDFGCLSDFDLRISDFL